MRKLGIVLVAVSALVACKKKGQEEKAQETAKPAETKPGETKPGETKPAEATPLKSEALPARWTECMGYFSAKDEAKFMGCLADDVSSEFIDSGMPPTNTNKAVVDRAKMFWTGFPDVKATPQLILVSGSNFATVDLITGTHSGEFMGMAKTDKKVGYNMAHYGQVDLATGKAKVVNGVMDAGTVMGQVTGDKKARPVIEKGWPDAPKIVVAKDDETERNNVATWNKSVADWNAHSVDKLTAYYADDATFHDAGAGDVSGKKAIGEAMNGYWKAFSDLKGSYSSVWGAGDWIVAIGEASGTNDGDLPALGVKKTGKKVTLKTVEFARFEGGKVKDHWIFYNGMAMAMQLGLVPPPGAKPAEGDKKPAEGDKKPAEGDKKPAEGDGAKK